MTLYNAIFLIILTAFYGIYLVKMLLLRRQGIDGSLLGKGEKTEKKRVVELILRLVTLLGGVIQFVSVLFPHLIPSLASSTATWYAGAAGALLGCILFTLAVIQMRENWRAGFSASQNTSLVTHGIYSISRNPAFVGFDLLYIGCAIGYPNIINITAAIAAVILFHMQILGEEAFLTSTFGATYAKYSAKVRRYLGRRSA